ncbi:MAG: hypothetical protein A2052_06255 [Deltaproteobacteria bacterium GWA2_54_12]|nr:MAG: hypothetical protein A2052_06255 [Deltaproteobacteria bacterium GWA2_54_12]
MPLPSKISPCPIDDAAIELRFDAAIPYDAIFGLVYNSLKDKYPEVEKLPILQVPEDIRIKDPNLIYKPYYAMKNDNLQCLIGPRTIAVSHVQNEYLGWDKFLPSVLEIFKIVEQLKIVKRVEKLGMRYVNFFNFNIYEKINLNIHMGDRRLADYPTYFRTEMKSGKYTSALQVANNATHTAKKMTGSIIDIDVTLEDFGEDFFERKQSILNEAHLKEKELFFELLKPEFIKTLNPEYASE